MKTRLRPVWLVILTAVIFCQGVDVFRASARPLGPTTLQFGVGSRLLGFNDQLQLPNAERWQTLINTFTSHDPEAGNINIHVSDTPNLARFASSYDCFYLSANPLPSTIDIENTGILSLILSTKQVRCFMKVTLSAAVFHK